MPMPILSLRDRRERRSQRRRAEAAAVAAAASAAAAAAAAAVAYRQPRNDSFELPHLHADEEHYPPTPAPSSSLPLNPPTPAERTPQAHTPPPSSYGTSSSPAPAAAIPPVLSTAPPGPHAQSHVVLERYHHHHHQGHAQFGHPNPGVSCAAEDRPTRPGCWPHAPHNHANTLSERHVMSSVQHPPLDKSHRTPSIHATAPPRRIRSFAAETPRLHEHPRAPHRPLRGADTHKKRQHQQSFLPFRRLPARSADLPSAPNLRADDRPCHPHIVPMVPPPPTHFSPSDLPQRSCSSVSDGAFFNPAMPRSTIGQDLMCANHLVATDAVKPHFHDLPCQPPLPAAARPISRQMDDTQTTISEKCSQTAQRSDAAQRARSFAPSLYQARQSAALNPQRYARKPEAPVRPSPAMSGRNMSLLESFLHHRKQTNSEPRPDLFAHAWSPIREPPKSTDRAAAVSRESKRWRNGDSNRSYARPQSATKQFGSRWDRGRSSRAVSDLVPRRKGTSSGLDDTTRFDAIHPSSTEQEQQQQRLADDISHGTSGRVVGYSGVAESTILYESCADSKPPSPTAVDSAYERATTETERQISSFSQPMHSTEFDEDDSPSVLSRQDLALDAPESFGASVAEEPRSYASFCRWRAHNSQSFHRRPERPPRALAEVGRQICLSEKELSDIIDAANINVPSFDRQVFDPKSNEWKYIECSDGSKLKSKLSETTRKALKRSEGVDALDANIPPPGDYSTLSYPNRPAGLRRTTYRNSCSFAENALIDPHGAARPVMGMDCCTVGNGRFEQDGISISHSGDLLLDNKCSRLDLVGGKRFDHLHHSSVCYVNDPAIGVTGSENDPLGLPVAETPPSGPHSTSMITWESPPLRSAVPKRMGVSAVSVGNP